MSTELTWQTVSTSLENTAKIAAALGRNCRGGEVIELVSDLGGGKTTFVRGLADGMGSKEIVSSPTFTISRQYQAGRLTLHHYDFYRLADAGIMADELAEVVNDPQAVVAIEWADVVENVLPERRVTLHIVATGESERQMTFTYPESLSYLFPERTGA